MLDPVSASQSQRIRKVAVRGDTALQSAVRFHTEGKETMIKHPNYDEISCEHKQRTTERRAADRAYIVYYKDD